MKKNLKNSYQRVNDFFAAPPSPNQKAWEFIADFYNLVLTYMQENNIKQSDLAKKLGISRSAVSQLLNQTPNISAKKMVEIADAIGITLQIQSPEINAFQREKESSVEVSPWSKDHSWFDYSCPNDDCTPVTSDFTNLNGSNFLIDFNKDAHFRINY